MLSLVSTPSNGYSPSSGAAPLGVPRSVWLLAAAAVVLRVVVLLTTQFTNEDFMITLRYVENLAGGHGLVYNPGERVLGTTTPLYAIVLAFGSRIGISPVFVGKTLNIAADGALVLVVYLWLREWASERICILTAFMVAANPLHARWAISGMETSLVTLVGMTAWLLLVRRRYLWCYAALAVLFLLRWDSAMLTGIVTLAYIWRERRLPLRELALYALIVAPWLGVANWYYGSPIPVTAASKMAVYGWQFPGFLPQAHKLGERLWGNGLFIVITVWAVVGLKSVVSSMARSVMIPAVAWLGIYWIAWLVSGVLLFEWYMVPPLPVYETLAAVGIAAMLHRFPVAALPRAAVVGLAAVVLIAGGWRTYSLARANQEIEEQVRKPLALQLRAEAKHGDTVMLEPIGYIGYYSRLRVLDVIGLVSPQVVPFWKRGARAPIYDIAQAFKPEWCVLRPSELADVEAEAQRLGTPWRDQYELVRTYERYAGGPAHYNVTFHVFRRRH